MTSASARRRALVAELEAAGSLCDPKVRRAFLAVPRERFLPGEALGAVYADKVVVTRRDERGAPISSSSQPSIMAVMLERLHLQPGHRVLEVGTGTGYNAALLSSLVGPSGQVTSVELEPDLAASAAATLVGGGYRADVVAGDGRNGWAAGAPYDRIVVTASTGTVHRSWFDQLVVGGLLELPMHLQGPDLQAVVTLRKDDGRLRSVEVVDGGFMLLRDPGRAAPPGPPGSSLTMSEHVEGRHRTFGSLTGDGLRRLGPAARTRLAALMLDRPRVRRLPAKAGNGGSPALFLNLARPSGAVVARYYRSGLEPVRDWAAAVATLDGRSLAVLAFTRGGGIRRELRGDDRAGAAVDRLLADWRARGRPTTADLDVSVTYGNDGAPCTRLGWRRAGRAGQSSTVRARR